jgi:hypothetical protein
MTCKEHDEYTICELCKWFKSDKLLSAFCSICIHNPLYTCEFERRTESVEEDED